MKKLTLLLVLLLGNVAIFPLQPILSQSTPMVSRGYFSKSPRLINAVTTYNAVRVWQSTYYFTVEILENAGNTLSFVTIQQRRGSETIRFYLNRTVAFKGTYRDKRDGIPIQSVTQDPDTQAITIQLDSPVPSGTVFTIGLKPIRNPDYAGVYLFGVTVYPSGENPLGLYLGVGRLHFYQGGNGVL